jgi:hypothetical protein
VPATLTATTGLRRLRRDPAVPVGMEGLSMTTTVLAYLIVFMGFITTPGGLFGALMLLFEEVSKTERIPFRYYAMISGALA